MRYVGFASKWQWAGPSVDMKPAQGSVRPFVVSFANLPVSIEGRLERSSEHEATVHYTIRVGDDLRDVRGVGLEFVVPRDAGPWPSPPQVRIEQARDLTLGTPELGTVQLRFESAKRTIRTFQERGRQDVIRAMLLEGDVPKGSYEASLRITLPDEARWLPSLQERYGPANPARWHPATLTWNDWPVDLSRLNEAHGPAGSHGHLEVRGDALVFADGTPARFWGTNITAQTLFEGGNADIERQADRLSALGYNLVRLHHHDVGWIQRNVFDRSGGTTQALDDGALERLDWWIKCLRDRGIYVWIDLHVGRRFLPGDGISGFDEMNRGPLPQEGKGFNYVNPRVEKLMQRFAKQYLSRRNRHTGASWAKDPAILGVLVTNENDLTEHFGAAFLPDKGRPLHGALYKDRAQKIANALGLPMQQAKKVWRPGPGKVLLAEMQHRFDARSIEHLRTLGVQAPIATTNFWGHEHLFSLPPLTTGDMIDVHAYGDAEAPSTNPRYTASWVHEIAMAQVAGKPLTVTEWSVSAPAADRFTAPLWMASLGALQGWDAMMAFCYNMGPNTEPQRINRRVTWTDPSLLALAPAAALLYRRGDVRPAQKTYVLRPSVAQVWNEARNASNSAALRTLPEQSKVVLELPDHPQLDWDRPVRAAADAIEVTDLDRDFLPADARAVESDTGELRRDWVAGVQTIDTARTQAASGWIGGLRVELADVVVEIETPKAAVVVSALDDQPIATSELLLVTAVARSTPDPAGGGGYRSEPVVGRVSLQTGAGRALVPLSGGSRARTAPSDRVPIPGEIVEGRQSFELPSQLSTHWYLIVPSP